MKKPKYCKVAKPSIEIKSVSLVNGGDKEYTPSIQACCVCGLDPVFNSTIYTVCYEGRVYCDHCLRITKSKYLLQDTPWFTFVEGVNNLINDIRKCCLSYLKCNATPTTIEQLKSQIKEIINSFNMYYEDNAECIIELNGGLKFVFKPTNEFISMTPIIYEASDGRTKYNVLGPY